MVRKKAPDSDVVFAFLLCGLFSREHQRCLEYHYQFYNTFIIQAWGSVYSLSGNVVSNRRYNHQNYETLINLLEKFNQVNMISTRREKGFYYWWCRKGQTQIIQYVNPKSQLKKQQQRLTRVLETRFSTTPFCWSSWAFKELALSWRK